MISPACTAGLSFLTLKKKDGGAKQSSSSQYWALLFAVGVYEGRPDQDRPSMLQACDNLSAVLLDSPSYWQASNIHVVKGGQCYLQALIKELMWLRKNSKSEDYVLVYLTTHGYYLTKKDGSPLDLPPKDEADATDEFLFMYNKYTAWYGIIWDDLLNFFLSRIKCKGLCLIVDSCYSGGFNDNPLNTMAQQHQQYAAKAFATSFVEDLAAPGRVVLMSCQENEVSYGSYFSDFLISGFSGWADATGNGDGINSAEESFAWAEFWVKLIAEQQPTIADSFGGEFPVTYS